MPIDKTALKAALKAIFENLDPDKTAEAAANDIVDAIDSAHTDGGGGGGAGDFTGVGSSTPGEIVLFGDESGKAAGRSSSFTGIAKLTAGVLSTVQVGTGAGDLAAGDAPGQAYDAAVDYVDAGLLAVGAAAAADATTKADAAQAAAIAAAAADATTKANAAQAAAVAAAAADATTKANAAQAAAQTYADGLKPNIGSVIVSGTPSAGQVPVATSSTTAAWMSLMVVIASWGPYHEVADVDGSIAFTASTS